MRFIGQPHIMRQLYSLLRDLYSNPRGANFLLRGPSGYGKTTMAISIANFLVDKDFEVYTGEEDPKNFRLKKRVAFIDEVHKLKNFEFLYPVMDAKTLVLIFATNQDSVLPEAFSNRCYEYIFDDYSDEELELIARESAGFSTTTENFMEIIEAGNRNPRIIKSLIDRLEIYFRQTPEADPQTSDYKKILEEVFRIKGGLDTLCRRYLEVLEEVGGTASLNLLKSILHVDVGTITNQVEPVLLRKKLVKITKKGRCLYDS